MTSLPTLRERLAQLAPHFAVGRLGLALAIVGSLIGAATEAAIAWLMKPLLDRGFAPQGLPLWAVPASIIGLFALRGFAGYIAECGLAWSAQRGIESLRRKLFNHLLRVEPALFGRHSASSLTNMVVYESNTGVQELTSAILTVLKDSLTVVAMLVSLLLMNWQLTLIVALLVPGVGVVLRLLTPRLRRLTVLLQHAMTELAYVVEENVLAWRVVRLHDAAAQERQRFDRSAIGVRRLLLKSVASSAAVTPVTQLIGAVAVSVVITVALVQSRGGSMTVGGFVQFVTAMLVLMQPLKRLSDVASPITRGLTYLERGMALLHEAPAERSGGHVPAVPARGDLALQGVTLRYRTDHAPALDRVDLAIRAGETVALVGPSGAGKSSLVHLLPRFVEPTEGVLRLDGTPLPEWDIVALRKQFALVSQDVVLFNGSIADNVALGTEPDEARVREALRNANLLDFVLALPDGLHARVGHNGSELSGGQRQRLAIARALYKDARVLILDEATSALDTESERAVQQALDRLMQGRTTLVIAHRLSTIERADRIVVMDAGRVVEQGPHAQLLAEGGLYARLHAMQFGTTAAH